MPAPQVAPAIHTRSIASWGVDSQLGHYTPDPFSASSHGHMHAPSDAGMFMEGSSSDGTAEFYTNKRKWSRDSMQEYIGPQYHQYPH